MEKNHTPKEVAITLKEIIRHKYGSLSEYALKKKITPTQLYNLLNGREYIALFSAARFSNDLDLNIEYCTKGLLPVFTQEHDYKKLKEAAEVFFYAVKEEDDFRNAYNMQKEKLTGEESSQLNALKNKLRINKAKAACALVDLLNIEGVKNSKEKRIIPKPIIPQNCMTLHEAIQGVLRHSGFPLTYAEIANLINEKGLYSRKDGKPVPASQISARIRHYPHLFAINRESSPQSIKLMNP